MTGIRRYRRLTVEDVAELNSRAHQLPYPLCLQTQSTNFAVELSAIRMQDTLLPAQRRFEAMLQKCANPACTAPFRSLREGKLFLTENYAPEGGDRRLRREHFWLCATCSAQFTLRFDDEGEMLTVPLHQTERLHYSAAAD
jgi:hypothetical protein